MPDPLSSLFEDAIREACQRTAAALNEEWAVKWESALREGDRLASDLTHTHVRLRDALSRAETAEAQVARVRAVLDHLPEAVDVIGDTEYDKAWRMGRDAGGRAIREVLEPTSNPPVRLKAQVEATSGIASNPASSVPDWVKTPEDRAFVDLVRISEELGLYDAGPAEVDSALRAARGKSDG